MARPKLRSPEQPLALRFLLGVYEFAASLKLAVLLILSLAGVLAWATFVEMDYGLEVVHFALYDSWWFGLLGALLAVNIFCAAVIRYPWKRHQTGFVITHLGLLILLFGCLLTRRGGIDAQMAILEDGTNSRAYCDRERIELAIQRDRPEGAPSQSPADEKIEVISIPFRGGPFNWSELDAMRQLPTRSGLSVNGKFSLSKALLALPNWAAWNLAPVDRGLLYDRDGIRVEALDYYSNSEETTAPRLRLALTMPRMTRMDSQGRPTQAAEQWMPVELALRDRGGGLSERRKRVGGGNVVFWQAADQREVDAFLDSRPDDPPAAAGKGQVVLHAFGQRFTIRIDDALGKPPLPLGDSGLKAQVVRYFAKGRPHVAADGKLAVEEDDQIASNPAVQIAIGRQDEPPATMFLFADYPEFNAQLRELGVFGSYWIDAGQKSTEQLLAGQGGSRIDIVVAPDQRLYYRIWNRHEVVAARPLPLDGTAVDAFKMPIAQLKMRIDRYIPADKPGNVILPVSFNKSANPPSSFRAVKLRLTVDGNRQEFWLLGPPPGPFSTGLFESEVRTVQGRGRRVSATLPLDHVDVGFVIRLRDFERKLDPGTSQPSHYSSIVDFLDEESGKPAMSNVLITMNAPVDFSNPHSGRSYRLFQESFAGPFLPGDAMYERFYNAQPDNTPRRRELYSSTLTVNYDPGRGVKYCGCLLVVAGIVTMFYMRAYFFTPRKDAARRSHKRELVAV